MQDVTMTLIDAVGDEIGISRDTVTPKIIIITCTEEGTETNIYLSIEQAKSLRSFLDFIIHGIEGPDWETEGDE